MSDRSGAPVVINLFAPGRWDWYDSYGLIACRLLRHLSELGVWVNAQGLVDEGHDNQPADVAELISRPILPAVGGIFLGYPTSYGKHINPLSSLGPRLAITMFESSRIPGSWIEPLNACDAVVVPSIFCRDSFVDSGVISPIHVVPLGVSEVYKRPVRRLDGGPLRVLSFLDRGKRKGGWWSMPAFVRAFGDSPDARLTLKARNHREGMPRLVITNDNIDLLEQDQTEEELYRLYISHDVLLNPNMGEGFGLIPREFAATGGTSLTTGWGGTSDDIGLWGMELPYELVAADWENVPGLSGLELGVWAMPDLDGAADALRHVQKHRSLYNDVAMISARRVFELYSWERFAVRILEIWGDILVNHRGAALEAGRRGERSIVAGYRRAGLAIRG